MKIVFIGATGMLGKPVAQQLIAEGHELTLLGRNENKLKELFPLATIIQGDIFDKSSLIKAFAGQDAVYMNLSVGQSSKEKDPQPEREGIENILAVAKETTIRRIACISSLVHLYQGMNGYNWWAFRIKQDAVKRIKNSGIPYTLFYPSTFMETFPYQMMQGKKIAAMGRSLMPMWFIAADDYAKQVARSFTILKDESREYNVQGPGPYTFEEATKVFIANYQKAKLSVLRMPLGLAKFIGSFNQKLNYVWHICEALNKYPEKFESQQTWDELGKPTIRLADFAKNL
ncbi:MAG: NAD(P)H-binding protein [Chitinophagaceae bacterium]|nr:NAD(P)H-binding protein [Chitinophagaceae bacterium]